QQALTDLQAENHRALFIFVISHKPSRLWFAAVLGGFLTSGLKRSHIKNKAQYHRLKQEYSQVTAKNRAASVRGLLRMLNSQKRARVGQDAFTLIPRTLLADICGLLLNRSTDYLPHDVDRRKPPIWPVASPIEEYLSHFGEHYSGLAKVLFNKHQAAEAQRLLSRYFELRNRIVKHNVPLVIKLARQRAHNELSASELIQEGVSGLIRAAEKYDRLQGTRFSTYAYNWIDSKIRAAKVNEGAIVKISPDTNLQLNKLLSVQDGLRSRGLAATDAIVARALDIPVERVIWLREINRNTLSIYREGSDGERAAGDERLPSDITTLDQAHKLHLKARLDEQFRRSLPSREQKILSLRYGLNGNIPHTIEAIGKRLKLSSERVRQIELDALSKLHKALSGKGWQSHEG
ncbi:MAG TPA: sigma-70 family RNA polymerase sigma factor, partial [Marinagarivorans sp.]